MKGAITPLGYTIIEVMIVLAVSGLMFLIAADFINGKQEAASFPQGVNELASSLQNTIEEVTDGQYSDIDFTCNFTYGASQVTISPGGQTYTNSITNDTQGTQSNCVFLGKVVQFGESGPGIAVPAQQYETFTLAGGRLDGSQPITNLTDDAPTVVFTSTATLTTQSTVPEHLNVIAMGLEPVATFPTSMSPTSYGIGFLQNLGSTNEPGTQDGAQPLDLYYVSGWTDGLSQTDAQNSISGSTLTEVPSGDEVVMCVTDYKQYAYIEIGNINNQLGVAVKMLGGIACS